MKKFSLILGAALIGSSFGISEATAQNAVILDLTKATTQLEFNAENGSWTGTFDDDEESIESQCFSFVHSSMGDYNTWWGFTASNSADNSNPTDVLEHQWSNMAKGGIVLDENGEVKLDDFGAPVVSVDVPYIVAYYNAYMSRRPVDLAFNDGKLYEPQGVYLNLNSYAYYSVEFGDAMARAFTNGDTFTLTIHGVAADESETTVDVTLASFANGDLIITKGWKYVDLTPLGLVNEIYFTMQSTDSGSYGMNTPGYFCLDKLSVKPATDVEVSELRADAEIRYDRAAKQVAFSGADFAMVCDAQGNMLMSSDNGRINLSSLAAGVYVVKAGNKSLKIVK